MTDTRYVYRNDVVLPGGNLLVSATGVWAVWKVPRHSDSGLSANMKVALRDLITAGLSTLADVEFHLLATPVIYSANEWCERLLADHPHLAPGGRTYYESQAAKLDAYGAAKTSLDLLIRVGDRSDGFIGQIIDRFRRGARVDRPDPSTGKMRDWQARVDQISASLEGHLFRARRASADEVAALVAHTYHRGESQPPVPVRQGRYGRGHMYGLGHVVYGEPDLYALPILNPDTGEPRAWLSWVTIAVPPDDPQRWPGSEWLTDDLVPFPTIRSVRGRTIGSTDLAHQADVAANKALDQQENTAGTSNVVPPEMRKAGERLLRIREEAGQTAVVAGVTDVYARIGVYADTHDEVNRRAQQVIDALQAIKIIGYRIPGGQARINAEAEPGGRVWKIGGLFRDPHDQRFPLETLAGSGLFFTKSIGDGYGPLIGDNEVGEAVHHYPLYPILENRGAGTIICGKSGHSGKTTLGLLMASQVAYLGGAVLCIDPSRQMRGVVDYLSGDDPAYGLGNIDARDLGDGDAGALDPFLLAGNPDDPDYADRATEIASATLHLLLKPRYVDEYEEDLTRAARIVATSSDPSLGAVVKALENDHSRPGLDRVAEAIKQAGYFSSGKVLFSNRHTQRLRVGRGLTILGVRGVRVPDRAKPRSEYTARDRYAATVMYLLAEYARMMVNDDDLASIPKYVLIDEAWSFTNTEQGAHLIPLLFNDGRKRLACITLCSQAADHFPDVIVETAGVRFIGAAESERGAAAALSILSLDDTPAARRRVRNLPPHTFIMQTGESTGMGRVTSQVTIRLMFPLLRKAFDTTPRVEGATIREPALT